MVQSQQIYGRLSSLQLELYNVSWWQT
jgi:hypothetical protein